MTEGQHASVLTQRETYRLVDKVLAGRFDDAATLLTTLVKDVCDREEFAIAGARVWELDPVIEQYHLVFQYGSVAHIPDDYGVEIAEQPIFTSLYDKRVVISTETDALLRQTGITKFAATGVGEIDRRNGMRLYHYVLAFNAPELAHDIDSTITVISSATTTALRNLSLRKQQAQIKKDLDRASEIQRSLLPEHTLEFHEFSVFGISVPDSVVGGDYFDYLNPTSEDDEQRSAIVISDAASKGLPAAVQALFVSGAIRMGIGFNTKITSLISRLNTLIYDTFPYERFVTLCYCELTQSKNGLILYCNAGHCSPLHYRQADGDCVTLDPTGSILGISNHQRFRVESINMQRGDILLLFTDGVIEAQNEDEEQFGEQRLRQLLHKHRNESAKVLAYTLLEEVQNFAQAGTYTDDKTLVVIKRDHFGTVDTTQGNTGLSVQADS